MAHPEQMEFVSHVRSVFPSFFRKKRVLEVGSRNVNGSVRIYFEECDYVGIDFLPGSLVEVTSLAHEFDAEPFDVVISCEAFEHDPYLDKTIPNVMRLLKPSGLVVVTTGGPNRLEHGTHGTDNLELGPDMDFFRRLTAGELSSLFHPYCSPIEAQEAKQGQDVYLVGFRRKTKGG